MKLARRRFAKRWLSAGLLCALCASAGLVGSSITVAAPLADDVSAVVRTAERQFDAGNYAAAISTLQSGISQNPPGEVSYWLGRSYYEIRDYDNAIAYAEKSVASDAKNSIYHQWLGRAYGGRADRDRSFFLARKVKKEFEEAVRLNPANISARRDLEEFCLEAPWIVGGSKDEALAQVNAVAELDPIEGHLARGAYFLRTAKTPDLAEGEYRLVTVAKPNRVEPYLEVADFYLRQNQVANVQAAIEAAAQVNASDGRLAFYRGVAGVLGSSALPMAERDLKSYLASSPDRSDWPSHASARVWLGRLYEAEGKRTEAAEQYRAALQLNPSSKAARTRLEQLEKTAR